MGTIEDGPVCAPCFLDIIGLPRVDRLPTDLEKREHPLLSLTARPPWADPEPD
jgi:hypothetical protein